MDIEYRKNPKTGYWRWYVVADDGANLAFSVRRFVSEDDARDEVERDVTVKSENAYTFWKWSAIGMTAAFLAMTVNFVRALA